MVVDYLVPIGRDLNPIVLDYVFCGDPPSDFSYYLGKHSDWTIVQTLLISGLPVDRSITRARFVDIIAENAELAAWLLQRFPTYFQNMLRDIKETLPMPRKLEELKHLRPGDSVKDLCFWINLGLITIQDCRADNDVHFVVSVFRRKDPKYCRDLAFLLNITDKDVEQMIETSIQEQFYEPVPYLENFLNNSHKRRKTLIDKQH